MLSGLATRFRSCQVACVSCGREVASHVPVQPPPVRVDRRRRQSVTGAFAFRSHKDQLAILIQPGLFSVRFLVRVSIRIFVLVLSHSLVRSLSRLLVQTTITTIIVPFWTLERVFRRAQHPLESSIPLHRAVQDVCESVAAHGDSIVALDQVQIGIAP